ncbi:MAG TPA: tRNA pseudouridine(55) synthase TruB [Actinomycetes bacterium]
MIDGVLVCDKAAGMTSHDVVARVRRLAGQRRVGHGGTLDPPATGVLVVALGRATRLLRYLPMEPKRYLAVIAFGAETDTLDATGTVVATADAAVDDAALRRALAGFLGAQRQLPPMVSAVKVGGERLYAKARRGETVDREPREVTVHALELRELAAGERPRATVLVTCSGGTYVRALAADLGRALGTVAHLASLRRTAVGAFVEADARPLDELQALAEGGRLGEVVIEPAAALAPLGVRPVSAREAVALASGQTLSPTGRDGPVAAVGPDGHLVAVIQDGAGRARSKVVVA